MDHCFTSKLGGVSSGPYEGLNMGYNAGDLEADVNENHQLLCKAVGLEDQSFVFSKQVHKTDVYQVNETFDPNVDQVQIKAVDGLITNAPNFALHTVYADCVPIFIVDPVNKAVGVAHAGWRGTVNRIAQSLLEAMTDSYGTTPETCLAGIGPSIGPCCFEVGKEVTYTFIKAFGNKPFYLERSTGTKDYIDLWKTNAYILEELGIPSDAIICAEMCTCCNPEYFYSYRRDQGVTGRMAGIIKVNSPSD